MVANKWRCPLVGLLLSLISVGLVYRLDMIYKDIDALTYMDFKHANSSFSYRLETFPDLDIKASTGWIYYRLGDAVRHKNTRKGNKGGLHLYEKYFPTSIAYEYMTLTDEEYNYDILSHIVNERSLTLNETLIPGNDTIVVHLRTGDVIDDQHYKWGIDLNGFLTKANISEFVKPLFVLQDLTTTILNENENVNITKILIVTGWHKVDETGTRKPIFYEMSIKYIDEVIKLFRKIGFDVNIRINENPDLDFLIMSNSKYYICGGGGYDLLIKTIVQMKGGIAYGCWY